MRVKTDPARLQRQRERLAKRRENDPEYVSRTRAYQAGYRKANREKLSARNREYQRSRALEIRLRRKGADVKEYENVLASQGNTCAICDGPPGGRWDTYNIDHDHKTGRLRGLLCKSCNQGIGLFKDNPQLLQRAAQYLTKS